jgi:nucleoside-diphosphate-sugar epimerase
VRVLIIGGTRFIGSHVVKRLNDMGHEITVFHRGQNNVNLPNGINHILGERAKLPSFIDKFKQCAPDVVLDMFPYSEKDAQAVINTFKHIADRTVAISSQDVYRAYGLVTGIESGSPEPVPLSENAALRQTLYPYKGKGRDDYEKILAERVFMSDSELPSTILRLPAVYGPKDYQHRMFGFVKRMKDKRPFILLDEDIAQWRWTHGYVENVAFAIALAITDDRSAGRIYNVGNPETPSMVEWVREIGKTVGWEGEIFTVSKDLLPESMRFGGNTNQHIVTDSTRIRTELGYYEPIPPEEALKTTITWEWENPPEKFDYETEDRILSHLI